MLFGADAIGFLWALRCPALPFRQHRMAQWRRCGLAVVVLCAGVLLLAVELLFAASSALRITVISLVMGAQTAPAMRYRCALARTTHNRTPDGPRRGTGRILHTRNSSGPQRQSSFVP